MVLPKEVETFAGRLPVEDGRLHILTCAGIGDLLWVYSKFWSLCDGELHRDVTFWFPDGEPHRAGPLCQMLGVEYGYLPGLTTRMVWDWRKEHGDPAIPDSGAVLMVSANGHLESGNRIEKWYPEFSFRNPASGLVDSLAGGFKPYKLEVGEPQYVVVSIGEASYMGGQLMPAAWGRILREIERTVAPVVLIGAERSAEYCREVLRYFDPTFAPAFNVPLAELTPVLGGAKAVVGTASGITILSTYLGIPTLHAYPRHLRQMPGTWAQIGASEDSCFVDELENAVRDGFLADIDIARLSAKEVREIQGINTDFAETLDESDCEVAPPTERVRPIVFDDGLCQDCPSRAELLRECHPGGSTGDVRTPLLHQCM